MIQKKYVLLLSAFFFLTQCSNSPLDITKCNNLKTTSVEYLSCLNELYTSSNTAKNLREFKKHETLESFFKQVEVIESD